MTCAIVNGSRQPAALRQAKPVRGDRFQILNTDRLDFTILLPRTARISGLPEASRGFAALFTTRYPGSTGDTEGVAPSNHRRGMFILLRAVALLRSDRAMGGKGVLG